jgi:hypothetical protein
MKSIERNKSAEIGKGEEKWRQCWRIAEREKRKHNENKKGIKRRK